MKISRQLECLIHTARHALYSVTASVLYAAPNTQSGTHHYSVTARVFSMQHPINSEARITTA